MAVDDLSTSEMKKKKKSLPIRCTEEKCFSHTHIRSYILISN